MLNVASCSGESNGRRFSFVRRLGQGWRSRYTPHTLNLKEVGLARKTESPYPITCYNASRAGRRSFPMEIVGKVAATIQNVLGPEAEELGRATGVIQRRRKFTAVSLLRMLVLTLLR